MSGRGKSSTKGAHDQGTSHTSLVASRLDQFASPTTLQALRDRQVADDLTVTLLVAEIGARIQSDVDEIGEDMESAGLSITHSADMPCVLRAALQLWSLRPD